ncbi:MAG: DUF2934 domain-containing protein [Terracidiphilus sp.]
MAETIKKASTPSKARAIAPKKPATKKKDIAANGIHMTPSREEVARLAHRYWAERGHQHGRDAEDWFRAEQELLGKAS